MRIFRSTGLFLFIVVLILSSAISQDAAHPYSPGLSHYIEPSEAEELRISALHGDGNAARRLSDFYYLSESDPEDGVFWLRVSAENGHCGSQVRLAQHYRHRLDLSDGDLRSRAWLEIAEKNETCEKPANRKK